MLITHAIAALLAYGSALAFPAEPVSKRSVNFDLNSQKVRGLNIGGWLVLEPWITPSIFQKQNGPVDEYTLTRQLGPDAAFSVLKSHWDSFVSKADFQKIASAGFNTVRIPIGYWAFQKFDNDPYVQGAAPYLDTAIGWARETGLKVWVDLHGAPGSQNGFDNSGQKTANVGFQQGSNVQHTLDVLQQISDRYANQQDVVVAIGILNEPLGPVLDLNNLRQFYRDGYGRVRSRSDTPVALSDAFQKTSDWNGFLTPSDNNAQNVLLDHHEYQVFTPDLVALSPAQHRSAVCSSTPAYTGADKWTVIGEWSAAMTDCAAALNGYGIGARYDGTYPGSRKVGDCYHFNFFDQWDQQLKDDTRAYIEAQLDVFERETNGWIFWNFKAEGSPEWNAFTLLDGGVFPQPLGDRRFVRACG